MRVLVSGATGLVGRYLVEGLLAAGYSVLVAGRTPPAPGLFSADVGFVPLTLDPARDQTEAFAKADAFVHAAFSHLAGKYRGGEGDDPEGFRRLNLEGTVQLFRNARQAGLRRCVFLSSRAVYDGLPAGTTLHEDLPLAPGSLYGRIKLDAEHALQDLATPQFVAASLRMTGVYGELRPNKWDGMFRDYLDGKPILPRAGTEVHGRDVAAAVQLLLEIEPARINRQSFNLSDLMLDTRDILAHLPAMPIAALPAAADTGGIGLMDTGKIRALGWAPGGEPQFRATIAALAADLNSCD
jgi:nucleoside-diphosphate-sugar epimerase